MRICPLRQRILFRCRQVVIQRRQCARNRPIIPAKRAVSHVSAPILPAAPSPAGTHPPALPRRRTCPAPRESPANSPAPDRPSPARRPGIIRGGTRRNSRGSAHPARRKTCRPQKAGGANPPRTRRLGRAGWLLARIASRLMSMPAPMLSVRRVSRAFRYPAFAAARVKQLLWRIRQQRVDGVRDRLIAPRREHALTGGKQRRVIECIRLRRKQINAPAPVHIHGVAARAN